MTCIHPKEPGIVILNKPRTCVPWTEIAPSPKSNVAIELEPVFVGIEHHFLALTGVGAHEHHPTVAQAQVRYLHRCRDTV